MNEELIALAERCEQATRPDRELDAAIAQAVGAEPFAICDTGNVPWYSSYTASLDAAMTLVPDGWWVQHVGYCLNGWRARVERNVARHTESESSGFGPNAPPIKTAALALCAASLRARA